jgi:hypothetical protein
LSLAATEGSGIPNANRAILGPTHERGVVGTEFLGISWLPKREQLVEN